MKTDLLPFEKTLPTFIKNLLVQSDYNFLLPLDPPLTATLQFFCQTAGVFVLKKVEVTTNLTVQKNFHLRVAVKKIRLKRKNPAHLAPVSPNFLPTCGSASCFTRPPDGK